MLDDAIHNQAREILSSELFWPKMKEPAIEINERKQVLLANVENVTKEQLEYIEREALRLNHTRRREHRGEANITLTISEWLTIIHRYQGLCAYCRQKPFEVIEHIIPVSLGGGTTADNCVPACQLCNNYKANTKAYRDEQGNLFIKKEGKPLKKKRLPKEKRLPRERKLSAEKRPREKKVKSPMGILISQARKENPRPCPSRNPHTGRFTRTG